MFCAGRGTRPHNRVRSSSAPAARRDAPLKAAARPPLSPRRSSDLGQALITVRLVEPAPARSTTHVRLHESRTLRHVPGAGPQEDAAAPPSSFFG